MITKRDRQLNSARSKNFKRKLNMRMHKENILMNINSLVMDLRSDDGVVRESARHQFVKLGEDAVDYLASFITSEDSLLRWEVAKTLAEIASPVAVPVLIEALEDDLTSIRWIAGEGLIKLGRAGARGILVALVDFPDSVFIMQGAHHVLSQLGDIFDNSKLLLTLLKALEKKENDPEVSLLASRLVKELDKSKFQ
jgi:HEAT repeat protein